MRRSAMLEAVRSDDFKGRKGYQIAHDGFILLTSQASNYIVHKRHQIQWSNKSALAIIPVKRRFLYSRWIVLLQELEINCNLAIRREPESGIWSITIAVTFTVCAFLFA